MDAAKTFFNPAVALISQNSFRIIVQRLFKLTAKIFNFLPLSISQRQILNNLLIIFKKPQRSPSFKTLIRKHGFNF